MLKQIAPLVLLTGIIVTPATGAGGQPPPKPVTAEQMEAAIASFGVPQSVSSRAAAAAMKEIAQRRRRVDDAADGRISRIPDDLLDTSPY